MAVCRDKSMRDVVWYVLSKQGNSARQIGLQFGVHHATVRKGITREQARRRVPKVAILFPAAPTPFTPLTPCQHGIINDGDSVYCPVCHVCGLDGHPELIIDRKTEKVRTRQWDEVADGLVGGIGQVAAS